MYFLRKQHEYPMPMVGGLAMFIAMLLTMLFSEALHGNVCMLIGSAAALVALGVLDDKYGLSVEPLKSYIR